MESNQVGKYILNLRKENKLTQQEFADMFGVTYQAVSKWENGKNIPDILLLKDICKKFGVSIDDVLVGKKTEVKRKSKNLIFITITILLLITIVTMLFLSKKLSNSNFQFKTISSNCSNFNITGSIAYNDKKSSIYISDVVYCGGNDTIKYDKIECILYENNGNIDTKMDSYYTESNFNNTLEVFLQDLNFIIDNYETTCKEYDDSNIFLQVNAIDKNSNVNSYKIPLKIAQKCYIE